MTVLDVRIEAKLMKTGTGFILELQVLDEDGTDITDYFRLYAQLAESDLTRTDLIDALIRKK